MKAAQDDLYYKGYIAGYRDGISDAASGVTTKMIESDIANLRIKAMALSTRAHNCLLRAGCAYISDVMAFNEHTITTTRNIGAKTASEIARWLDEHGICYSAWSKYSE